MKTVEAMFGIILVLMFLVPIGLFIADSLGLAQEAGSRGANINNTEAMTQFIMYATYTAYQCTPDAGGFEKGTNFGGGTYWGSWEEVLDAGRHNGFQELKNAYDRDELNCYGAENKLPLSQGAWEEVEEGIREDDFWINDQEGKYSKRDFKITEKDSGAQGVSIGPCYAYEDGSGHSNVAVDFSFMVFDEDVPNVIRFFHRASLGGRQGQGFGEGNIITPLDPNSDCKQPAPSYNHDPNDGSIGVVTVLGTDGGLQSSTEVPGFSNCNSPPGSSCSGPGPADVKEWKLCPGTKGYIQVNTGKNKNEKGPSGGWNSRGSKPYNPENGIVPGSPDIEAGGSHKTNTPHPFIVLTEHVTPSEYDGPGTCS